MAFAWFLFVYCMTGNLLIVIHIIYDCGFFDTIVAAWAQQAIGKAKLRHQRYSVSGVCVLTDLLYKFIDCGF